MKVSEVMTPAAVTDRPDDTLAEAARKMWEQQTGSLVVTDGDELIGIVTERDVLKAVATGVPLEDTRVSDAMTKEVVTAHPGMSLREAAGIMTDKWIRHLPVLDRGALVGIVSQRDLSGVLQDETVSFSLGTPPPRVPLLARVREELEKAENKLDKQKDWDAAKAAADKLYAKQNTK